MRLADIISTVEFDSTGNYLATGDKGGRVVLFERNESVSISFLHFPLSSFYGKPDRVSDCPLSVSRLSTAFCIFLRYPLDSIAITTKTQKKGCEYKFYTEFQSHEPEFDYLKSLEIEEKINKIRWCRRQNSAHFLLSTNGIIS